MRLVSYSIANFRCFGTAVELADLGRVNVIAGPNNVGKSALFLPLRRLTRFDTRYVERVAPVAGVGEYGPGSEEPSLRFDQQDFRGVSRPVVAIELELDADEMRRLGSGALGWDVGGGPPRRTVVISTYGPEERVFSLNWGRARTEGDSTEPALENWLREFSRRVVYVPPTRAVAPRLEPPDTHAMGERRVTGESLFVDVLQWTLEGEAERLKVLNGFAGDVLGVRCAVSARVKPARLEVALGGEPARPLDALGGGVEQVLVIAAAVASVDRPILLLEEPELGLHPATQRRLVEALARASATTLLTTHSNHILDFAHDDVRHYHLFREGGDGERRVRSLSARDAHLMKDLGVRPSSVLQANAVIWVEGPSDAIYLRAWLKAFGGAEDLVEGVHFTFAFFGGALLEHVTVDEADEGRVRLPDIHPSWFLVADSDRDEADGPLGKRYIERLVPCIHPGRQWVTAGREVEDYVSDRELAAALGGTGPAEGRVANLHAPLGDRLKSLGLAESWKKKKVLLAERVVASAKGKWDAPLDLKERVEQLVEFVRQAQAAVVAAPDPPKSSPS